MVEHRGELTFKGHFIHGAFTKSSGSDYCSVNPFTGDDVFRVSYGDGSEVHEAVESAYSAWLSWRSLGHEERAAHLRSLAVALQEREQDLAWAIASEMGKIYSEALTEARACVGKIKVTLEEAYPWVRPFEPEGLAGACHFKPYGVMAVIGPYNFPAHLANGHIIGALMTGNTVVFKPSSTTPLVGQVYAEAVEASSLPAGVVNVLHIRRSLGDELITHPKVRGILFTGSYEVGLHLKEKTLKDPWKILALEMGGKNCAIATSSASVEQVIYEVFTGAYLTTGQRCTGTARLLIDAKIAAPVIEGLVSLTKGLESGDPFGADTFMGPLANKSAVKSFLAAQQQAKSNPRLKTLVPGQVLDHCRVSASLHLVEDYNSCDPFLREEVFGPALSIEVVASLEEAITRAQESDYGLSCSVFSAAREDFNTVLESVPCGIVNFNRATCGASGRLPFGGVGKSGNHRPAALFAPMSCAYPVAELRGDYGVVPEVKPQGFPEGGRSL